MTNVNEVNAGLDDDIKMLIHASELYATTVATLVKVEQKPEPTSCKAYTQEFHGALAKSLAYSYLSIAQRIHQTMLARLQWGRRLRTRERNSTSQLS